MRFWVWATGRLIAAGCCLWLTGCYPLSDGGSDEAKDPHYLAGVSRKMSRDYQGAIEAFEKALESNPHSSVAHYELGLIYYQDAQDFAAAIYHFQKYLKLRPNAPKRQLLREFIVVCKQELAKEVSLAIVNERVQRQLDELARENSTLRTRVEALTQQLAQATGRPAVVGDGGPRTPPNDANHGSQSRPPPASAGAGKYKVKPGDTLYGIARRHGVDPTALAAANPGLNPRRLRVGQEINLPARP